MELPDQLHCLFSARITERADAYTLEIPKREVDLGSLAVGQAYRVALLPRQGDEPAQNEDVHTDSPEDTTAPTYEMERRPPVGEGDERTVEIVGLGDQGDGITRIDNGFVVIVPDTERGERVRVEITDVRESVAFGEVVERLSYYA